MKALIISVVLLISSLCVTAQKRDIAKVYNLVLDSLIFRNKAMSKGSAKPIFLINKTFQIKTSFFCENWEKQNNLFSKFAKDCNAFSIGSTLKVNEYVVPKNDLIIDTSDLKQNSRNKGTDNFYISYKLSTPIFSIDRKLCLIQIDELVGSKRIFLFEKKNRKWKLKNLILGEFYN